MKNFILTILLLVLLGEVFYLLIPKKTPQKVLAEKTVFSSPSPTVTPPTSPSPSPSPTSKPTPVKTPTPIIQPAFSSQDINGFIDRFAGQYGVDPNVLRHIAICESSFDPKAYKAGYAGLFQFGATTWKNLRIKIGEDTNADLRYNAEEAVQTGAYALSQGKSGIWPNCRP